jgi:hypothetical protein
MLIEGKSRFQRIIQLSQNGRRKYAYESGQLGFGKTHEFIAMDTGIVL